MRLCVTGLRPQPSRLLESGACRAADTPIKKGTAMNQSVDRSALDGDGESPGEATPVAEIVDWVARGIIEGRLKPGDDLNSVDLAKRFSVSRTPVREALFVLSREGLVDWSPRRRPRVSTLNIKNVREIYHLRAVLYAQVSYAIVEQA